MSETAEMSDERKLRRFAMDMVRAMAEGVIDPNLTHELALQWGLIEQTEVDGKPWLVFTKTLLGNELTDA